MPQYKNGKGYSFWLSDEIVDNQLPVPRLLSSEKQAKKVIVEWAKGVFEWKEKDSTSYLSDQYRRIKPLGRSASELEVIPVIFGVPF